jgi:lipopolysaccharide exporter
MAQREGFTGRALRAVKWNYIGTIGRMVATFLSQILLARLLGPETFGVFGYAFLTVTLLSLVVDLGLARGALVQSPDLSREVIAVAMGRMVLASTVVTVLVVVFADVIATDIFRRPDAAPVIQAMAPSLVISTIAAASTAILTRDLEFRYVQVSGLLAYVAGYLVVGYLSAVAGWGVWSLVLAWYAFSILSCVAMAWHAPRTLTPANPFRRLPIAGFGYVIMATNFVNWFIDNAAHVIIGRNFGASPLGQFTVSNNLLRVPADNLVRNFQNILLPLSSRASGNNDGLRRAYLTVVSGAGLVVLPLFALLAMLDRYVVDALLGSKWSEAVPLMAPLCAAMVLHAIEAPCGPMLTGLGKPRVELANKLITLVSMVVALWVAAQSGSVVLVAWALAAVFGLRLLLMHSALARQLGIGTLSYLRNLAGPLLFAAVAAAMGVLVGQEAPLHAPEAPALVVLVVAGLLVAFGCLLLLLAAPALVLGPQLQFVLARLCQDHPGLGGRAGGRGSAQLR